MRPLIIAILAAVLFVALYVWNPQEEEVQGNLYSTEDAIDSADIGEVTIADSITFFAGSVDSKIMKVDGSDRTITLYSGGKSATIHISDPIRYEGDLPVEESAKKFFEAMAICPWRLSPARGSIDYE